MKISLSMQNLIFLLTFFLYVLLEIGRFFDHYTFGLIFPLLIFTYLLFDKSLSGIKKKDCLVFLALIFLSYMISSFITDFSFDGNAYHIPAIQHILSNGDTFNSINLPSYIRSYPKNSWYIGSALTAIFGSLNYSKINNLIALTISILMLQEFFKAYKDKLNFTSIPWKKNLACLSLIATPVYVCQIFTNYNDYFLYLLLFSSFLGILLLVKHVTSITLINGFLLSSISLAVKFNGFPLAFLIFFMYLFIAYKNKYYTLFIIFIFILITQIYDPYLLNYLNYRNIFYPIYGGNVDPIIYSSPWGIDHRSVPEFVRLIQANFLESGSLQVTYKIPLTIHLRELMSLGRPDNISAGFGLFGGLILCLFLLISLNLFFGNYILYSIFFLLGLFFSILYPGSSIARYSFLYPLIPSFLLIIYARYLNNFLVKFIFSLISINVIVSFSGFVMLQILKEDRLNFVQNNKDSVWIGDKYFTPYYLTGIENIKHDQHGVFVVGCYQSENLKFLPERITKVCNNRLL